jgi:hypothetical protein
VINNLEAAKREQHPKEESNDDAIAARLGDIRERLEEIEADLRATPRAR